MCGRHFGSVKRDAKIWEDFLKGMGIPFEMPHLKNGRTKVDDTEFCRIFGVYTGLRIDILSIYAYPYSVVLLFY